MKSRLLLSALVISLGLFTLGCGSDAPEPTPNATATIEPVVNEPEPSEPEADTENKTIRVGVNANSISPFTIIEDGAYSGFEIDIATEIVSRLYGNDAVVEWVPITSGERWSSLADGQIDMLVRLALHTVPREEQALFSGGYLLAGNSFLVLKEDGLTSVADLDGKNVAVLSYMEEGLIGLASLGYTLKPFVVENNDEAIDSLGSGQADSFYHDWALLLTVMDPNVHELIMVDSLLAPMGVAFSLDAQDLRDEVNVLLKEIISDGTWKSIFDKWFGIEAPWNIEDMFDYPA